MKIRCYTGLLSSYEIMLIIICYLKTLTDAGSAKYNDVVSSNSLIVYKLQEVMAFAVNIRVEHSVINYGSCVKMVMDFRVTSNLIESPHITNSSEWTLSYKKDKVTVCLCLYIDTH